MPGPQYYLKKPPTFLAMQWIPETQEATELEKWLFSMGYCIQRNGSSLLIVNKSNPFLTLEVGGGYWVVSTGEEHNKIVVMMNRDFQREYVLSDEQEPF